MASSMGNARAALFVLFLVELVQGTLRYYGTYLTYGSGDTIITVYHAHGGPQTPNQKWNVECLDGEAMVGIMDAADDFESLFFVWCKFIFDFKEPTNGLYPYYSGCHVRNFTNQFFCFNPMDSRKTVNTFVIGFWNSNYFWFINLYASPVDVQPYKCCKTPPGYYIDHMSCYYMPTRDLLFEYYDNLYNFIVYCATGYVMTGITKKVNPYSHEFHLEWIQCCRVGLGQPVAVPPPVIYSPSGAPAYHAVGPSIAASATGAVLFDYNTQYGTRYSHRLSTRDAQAAQRQNFLTSNRTGILWSQAKTGEANPQEALLSRLRRRIPGCDVEKDEEYRNAKKEEKSKPPGNRKHPSAVR